MQDNGTGRCIAFCHYNQKYDGIDCTGADGKTMNRPGHFEARITGPFIDGRDVTIVKTLNHYIFTRAATGRALNTSSATEELMKIKPAVPYRAAVPHVPTSNMAKLTQQYIASKGVKP